MRFRMMASTVTLAIIALCSVLLQAVGQEPVAAKKLYNPSGSETTITGTIDFNGEVPKQLRIDMSADGVCQKLAPRVYTEHAIINNGKLANVFIYIKSGDAIEEYSFAEPVSPAMLSHKDCRYVPRLLGIRVGQPLRISNDDPTTHNSHPSPQDNKEWNQSQSPGANPIEKSFRLPETFIPFKDNQHPWEKAYVGVFSHPFFAISDENGYYRIAGLPPGHYTLVAWHERFGEKTIKITISPNESRYIGFSFEPSPNAK